MLYLGVVQTVSYNYSSATQEKKFDKKFMVDKSTYHHEWLAIKLLDFIILLMSLSASL